MIGTSRWSRTTKSDEAEKPFWISYSDLMTALMTLFLVVMVVTLASLSKRAQEIAQHGMAIERQATVSDQRTQEIQDLCRFIEENAAQQNRGVHIDCRLNRINFGEYGQFKTGEYTLSIEGQQRLLDAVPLILEASNTPLGKKWLKQILIEGFTDTDGSYLYNLHLSLKRSEWVMCTLLRTRPTQNSALTAAQRKQIRRLFLAGGVAFNQSRDSKNESRRVELKLQFYGSGDDSSSSINTDKKFDDEEDQCMIG